MKAFRFNLASVLKFKRHRKRLAEFKQHQAAAVLERARAELGELNNRLTQACARLQGKLGKATDSNLWLAVYQQVALLEQGLHSAQQKVQRANQELEQAASERRETVKEVEALLILRRRHWLAYRAQRRQQIQEQLDEVSLRRWREGRPAPEV